MKRKPIRIVTIAGCGVLAAGACLLLAIQLVPTGVSTTNPPVVAEPNWDSPATRALAVRACFDCHSNETAWPLYTRIAPISWLVARDVSEGRQALNFSEWGVAAMGGEAGEGGERGGGGEAAEKVEDGSMPPALYTLIHPGARLSPEEQQQLIDGLIKSLQ